MPCQAVENVFHDQDFRICISIPSNVNESDALPKFPATIKYLFCATLYGILANALIFTFTSSISADPFKVEVIKVPSALNNNDLSPCIDSIVELPVHIENKTGEPAKSFVSLIYNLTDFVLLVPVAEQKPIKKTKELAVNVLAGINVDHNTCCAVVPVIVAPELAEITV